MIFIGISSECSKSKEGKRSRNTLSDVTATSDVHRRKSSKKESLESQSIRCKPILEVIDDHDPEDFEVMPVKDSGFAEATTKRNSPPSLPAERIETCSTTEIEANRSKIEDDHTDVRDCSQSVITFSQILPSLSTSREFGGSAGRSPAELKGWLSVRTPPTISDAITDLECLELGGQVEPVNVLDLVDKWDRENNGVSRFRQLLRWNDPSESCLLMATQKRNSYNNVLMSKHSPRESSLCNADGVTVPAKTSVALTAIKIDTSPIEPREKNGRAGIEEWQHGDDDIDQDVAMLIKSDHSIDTVWPNPVIMTRPEENKVAIPVSSPLKKPDDFFKNDGFVDAFKTSSPLHENSLVAPLEFEGIDKKSKIFGYHRHSRCISPARDEFVLPHDASTSVQVSNIVVPLNVGSLPGIDENEIDDSILAGIFTPTIFENQMKGAKGGRVGGNAETSQLTFTQALAMVHNNTSCVPGTQAIDYFTRKSLALDGTLRDETQNVSIFAHCNSDVGNNHDIVENVAIIARAPDEHCLEQPQFDLGFDFEMDDDSDTEVIPPSPPASLKSGITLSFLPRCRASAEGILGTVSKPMDNNLSVNGENMIQLDESNKQVHDEAEKLSSNEYENIRLPSVEISLNLNRSDESQSILVPPIPSRPSETSDIPTEPSSVEETQEFRTPPQKNVSILLSSCDRGNLRGSRKSSDDELSECSPDICCREQNTSDDRIGLNQARDCLPALSYANHSECCQIS